MTLISGSISSASTGANQCGWDGGGLMLPPMHLSFGLWIKFRFNHFGSIRMLGTHIVCCLKGIPVKMSRPVYNRFFSKIPSKPIPQETLGAECTKLWMSYRTLNALKCVAIHSAHGMFFSWVFVNLEVYYFGGPGLLSMQILEKTKHACTNPLRTCSLRRASTWTRCLQSWHGCCGPADLGQENSQGWILHVYWAHACKDIYHIWFVGHQSSLHQTHRKNLSPRIPLAFCPSPHYVVVHMTTGLASQWEESTVIRSRFRRNLLWLQWPNCPIPVKAEESDEDGPNLTKHPIHTKSLELNADAVIPILDWANGSFVEIEQLQPEALNTKIVTLKHFGYSHVSPDHPLDVYISFSPFHSVGESPLLSGQARSSWSYWLLPWCLGFEEAVHICLEAAERCSQAQADSTGPGVSNSMVFFFSNVPRYIYISFSKFQYMDAVSVPSFYEFKAGEFPNASG